MIPMMIGSCEQRHNDKRPMESNLGSETVEKKNPDGLLEHLMPRLKFDKFTAEELDLNSALEKIENFMNDSFDFEDAEFTIETSSQGMYNPNITIVLKEVSVDTLLQLICDQTGLLYRIDSENLKIELYGITDTFELDDDTSDPLQPSILPPP